MSAVILLIETHEGERLLLNPGPAEPVNSAERILMPFLAEKNIHSLDMVLITGTDEKKYSGLEFLKKSIRIKKIVFCPSIEETKIFHLKNTSLQILPGSRSMNAEIPLLLTHNRTKMILANQIPLKTQDWILDRHVKKIDLIQAHFSKAWLWRENFIEEFRPALLVETGMATANKPSCPPWKNARLIIPQKLGVYVWKESELLSIGASKKPNENKTGRETSGMGPPRHTAHLASHGGGQ